MTSSGHFYMKMLFLFLVLYLTSQPASAIEDPNRDRAVEELASQIQQAGFHRIYVADFLTPSGKRDFGGCYFASVFSTKITQGAKHFEVVNRVDAQKIFTNATAPDGASILAGTLGIDGLVTGTIDSIDKIRITIILRDAASGQEIQTLKYEERADPSIVAFWPTDATLSVAPVYFGGLDGISMPRCKSTCTDPAPTEEARRAKYHGVIYAGIFVVAEGKVSGVRILNDPKNGLAERCAEVIRKWRFEPAKDLHGKPVAVYVPVQISFMLN